MITASATHQVATALINCIDGLLNAVGLKRDPNAEEAIYIVIVVAVAFFIGWLISRGILLASQKFVKIQHSEIGRIMIENKTLTHCSYIIPPLVILSLIPFAFVPGTPAPRIIETIALLYFFCTIAIAVNSILTLIWAQYNNRDNTKNLPLKGVLNIGKGLVWAIVVIVSLSLLLHKSPVALLTGLGAFAAALMLIFKDSILGFVAGLQLANNDMLRVGDWIVVPNTPANGNVIDVSLSVVKVRNWDMTIAMLPPYTLVSTSFKNYRGMFDMGVRRIDVNYLIEPQSIVAATPEFIADIAKKYPLIAPFIAQLQNANQTAQDLDGTAPINGTLQTNLGLFRAYLCAFLNADPEIAHNQNMLISLGEPNYQGYPLNIYCFTNTPHWVKYEAIQSRIMEHIAVAMNDFALTYSYSGSYDISLVKPDDIRHDELPLKPNDNGNNSIPNTNKPAQPDADAPAK